VSGHRHAEADLRREKEAPKRMDWQAVSSACGRSNLCHPSALPFWFLLQENELVFLVAWQKLAV
jgi:hypothetical protein